MKKKFLMLILFMVATISMSAAEEVRVLRGELAIDDTATNIELYQMLEGITLHKNYRQQPPLIPHKIEKYQINLKANQCLRCHSWEYSSDYKTVAAPESHFIGSQTGKRTDNISADRWFCTQCHVPQSNAPELIDNIFTSSDK